MNRLITLLALLFATFNMLSAANGDTTRVNVFDKFSMNRYGSFDKKVKLPDASKKYQRIWLKYTLGCESNGQCEWDYTLKLFFREHTGKRDSTLKQAPRIRLTGSVPDSVSYSTDTTWVNTFNTVTKETDSALASLITVYIYGDTLRPLLLTDSIKGFTANYYRYSYDSTGKKTDSVWIAANSVIRQKYTSYYEGFEVVNDLELGRFISPYAKSFPKTFQYDYVYDVTDYAYLFAQADSAEMRIEYQGYSYGFTATWDMIYIEGTPARDVIAIRNVYNGGYDYGQSVSIEEKLNARSFTVPEGTAAAVARVIITGHGGENNENCAEFCPKSYYLNLNGQQIAEQLVWKDDCGANAIVAQPGTWIYNRANWCPGEKIRVFEHPLNVTAGSTNTIDMNMQPFTANGYAGYNLSMQLVYYKAPNFENDAAIEDILAPSRNFWHSKTNPICDNAKVVLKNWGSKPLTRALISSQISNGQVFTQEWGGNLAYGEQAEVSLMMFWPTDISDRTYKVWLSSVNSQPTDENTWNNTMHSEFEVPLTLPQKFVIETRTNNLPGDNSYTITDSYGKTHKERTFTAANTLHRDTMDIGYGCYTLKFNDERGNGIDWWAAPSEGKGMCRIVTAEGPYKVLRSFSPDFGSFFQLSFRVQHPVGLNDINTDASLVKVYPNPANNVIFVEGVSTNHTSILDVTGKLVAEYNYTSVGMDVSNLPAGIYLLQITGKQGETFVKKITIAK
jgi:hypothetical protein